MALAALTAVRMGESGTDSPEHTHPDNQQWVTMGPERKGSDGTQVNRLRKPMRSNDWKHCSTCA